MASERVELAKHCSSRNWSKAIRVLDSLLAKQCSILDICNRAFCYNQLELHKHAIKDCDKALQLDSSAIQAYLLKGRALLALGRKQEAVVVFEQGYNIALQQTADVKQLLELDELLNTTRREIDVVTVNHHHATETTRKEAPVGSCATEESDEKIDNHDTAVSESGACSNGNTHESSSRGLGEQSKINSVFKESGGASNGLAYKEKENVKSGSQINGSSSRPCNGSDLHHDLSETSDRLGDLSVIGNKLSHKSGSISKLSLKTEARCGVSDETKINKKSTIARISETHSISVDFRLSRGIAQVNEGNYMKAISIFDKVLKEEPTYPEALIGRGTAYAFQRELENAIDDFTKAIQANPAAGEAWKRRGQARAALGEFAEAVEDLTRALELEPKSPDILHERGIINFRSKDFTAAVKDLSICLKQETDNKSAYTYLGLAFASLGEYTKAEEAHLKSIQLDSNYLEAWLHLAQFYQELADHSKALECIDQVLQVDNRVWKAYHLRGLVFQGLGEHRKAIQELSIGLSIESSIECLYLRGSCHHAVGEYREAVKDYDATVDVELDAVEKFVLQCLAFYQKELALYTASKVSSEFFCFDIDGDIDPMFKEYWCKRLHPKDVCEKVYRQPPLRESLKKGKLKKQDLAITKPKANLLRFTDLIGKKIQYHCPGFLPNRRQHRMAGLAVLEIAQKISKAWRIEWRNSNKGTAKNGKKNRRRERINMLSQNRGGAGCSTSSSSETSTGYASLEDRSSGRSMLSWQEVYSPAVRWRQISEPCDPVVWVNKLSEEFNSGFGSHTPMVLGQAKVIRYFPNYERTLNLAKTIIKEKLCVRSKADKVIDLSKDDKIEEIMRAETCEELHKIVGEDFWVATWCHSTASEGKRLEGTRITCIKKPGSLGYDFAIRTPCTPARWSDFDEEMTSAWEALCNAYCGESYGSTDLDALETVRDAILRMTYYWYNFMPLARGTAVTGFVVLLGLLLAANMEFTESRTHPVATYFPKRKVDKKKSLLGSPKDSDESKPEVEKVVDKNSEEVPVEWVSLWKPNVTINLVDDFTHYSQNGVPPNIAPHLLVEPSSGNYYPMIYFNEFWLLRDKMIPINETVSEVPLNLEISPISMMKWQLFQQVDQSFQMQRSYGSMLDGESDELKRVFLEGNPYLLGITMCVSMLHSVFDFLAFKNDIQFWNKNKSMEGLSAKSVVLNFICQFVIFLYLLDNDTSWMILASSGVGVCIEFWKIGKAMRIEVDRSGMIPRLRFHDRESYASNKTKEYDDIAIKFLSYVLLLLVVGLSIYSLAYERHKSWYSWILSSLTSCVYMFGFIMMCPQLFINYKLKSVAHLPWRQMTYKFLNTIIDDLFAFVIKMPILHRLSVFRDDVIFLIYLYQRWVYPVDKTRVNEFGFGGEDETAEKKLITEKQEEEDNKKTN